VKELELLKIVVPDEFVAGGIIAKLPPSWRDFATTQKHKRTHMSISDMIASLAVEEKVWTKDGRYKGVEGQTSVNIVHQPQSHVEMATGTSPPSLGFLDPYPPKKNPPTGYPFSVTGRNFIPNPYPPG
jgi:hypothetical protein